VRILFAGASGFLGTALAARLAAEGAETRRLVRRSPSGDGEWRWDPAAGTLPAAALDGVDVVVNLAGAPIAHWPWTDAYRRTLLDSRVETTRTIVQALRDTGSTPALVNASAVGAYGKDRGDDTLTEDSSRGPGFLADVVAAWETEARAAEDLGCRVVRLRTAVVLDGSGGALQVMRVPFRFGLGGRFGDGSQWFSTISLRDYCAAVTRLVSDDALSGAFNLTGPEPATNADLTRLLGQILHRPTLMRVPAFALKAVLGDLSGELLGSLRVLPERLLDAGFTFTHPTLEGQLRAGLS
jgi:uncharacterized protein (TIGR01777 family)